MVTYYNRKDLVQFGNYLLSDERKKRLHATASKYGKEAAQQVCHADIENWLSEKDQKPNDIITINDIVDRINQHAENPGSIVTPTFGDNWKKNAMENMSKEMLVDIAWLQGRRALMFEAHLLDKPIGVSWVKESVKASVPESDSKPLGWRRYRFYTAAEDNRPLLFNPSYPWWCTGYSGHCDDYSIIVAYLPYGEELSKYWDDAFDIEFTEESEIQFSDRFPKPDYYKPLKLYDDIQGT